MRLGEFLRGGVRWFVWGILDLADCTLCSRRCIWPIRPLICVKDLEAGIGIPEFPPVVEERLFLVIDPFIFAVDGVFLGIDLLYVDGRGVIKRSAGVGILDDPPVDVSEIGGDGGVGEEKVVGVLGC